MPQQSKPIYVFYLLIALTAYALPWIYAVPQVLALNAYDLAEWTSLHPSVRNQNPALMTTFWLRLTLTLLTLLFAAWTIRKQHSVIRFLYYVSLGILIILQLPPLEIINNPTDSNYLQQLSLALASLLGLIAIRRSSDENHHQISLALSIAAGISAWLGFQQAHMLMGQFGLESTPGLGMVLFFAASGIYWLYSAMQIINGRRFE